jgi:predicted double-glycine peptidase
MTSITIDLPRIKQTLDYSCGAACFESMYRFLKRGEHADDLFFACELGTLELGYTLPERVAELALQYNFKVDFQKGLSLQQLQLAFNTQSVLFVTWWYEDSGHYSLVKSIDESHILLMDPWEARDGKDNLLTLADFEKFWTQRGAVLISVS